MGKRKSFRKKTGEGPKKALPLRFILALITGVTLIVVTAFFTLDIYRHEKRTLLDDETSSLEQTAALRLVNLDAYFEELAQFSVSICYELDIYQTLVSSSPEFTSATLDEIKSFVRTAYFSRSDLTSYSLSFLNQGWSVCRADGNQHPSAVRIDAEELRRSRSFRSCVSSGRNYAVFPSEEEDATLLYCHTVIRISDGEPCGLIELRLRPSFADTLPKRTDVARNLCLVNEEGEIFYTDLSDEAATADAQALLQGDNTLSGSGLCIIGGRPCLYTRLTSQEYGLTICCFTSYRDLMSRLRSSLLTVIGRTVVFTLLLFSVSLLFLRRFTRPLTRLAGEMSAFNGRFFHTDVGGCLEAEQLAAAFNQMSDNIRDLIEQNYAVKLSEQNARLSALEAQVNPHFLYNTLQAIGSEALLLDDLKVYEMLTTLADCLRYSLKKTTTVPLSEELLYTENYFRLQKLRKGEHIELTEEVEEETRALPIPKLALQNLIENSIEHGIGGEVTSIRIELTARRDGTSLLITVTDDGCGMDEEELARLLRKCRDTALSEPDVGIGLPNLYHRLQILYRGSELSLTSRTEEVSGTRVSIRIPLKRTEV